MIGLFCKVGLGAQKKLEDFELSKFSKAEDCLGKSLLAVLTCSELVEMNQEDSIKVIQDLTCRMQARAKEALWFSEKGLWIKLPQMSHKHIDSYLKDSV